MLPMVNGYPMPIGFSYIPCPPSKTTFVGAATICGLQFQKCWMTLTIYVTSLAENQQLT
jgi:hypothetical protein